MNIIGINTGKDNSKIISGTVPILFSAPHAVKQIRNGNVKEEDRLTGTIVEYLCKKTNANGIVRTYNCCDDPNYENVGNSLRYKQIILNIIKQNNIKLLIDIHACKDKYGFDFELGTNSGKNINYDNMYLNIFKEELTKIGKTVIDKKFTAKRPTTVSSFINQNSGIQCIQIEISKKFRRTNIDTFKLLETFENIVDKLNIK